MDRPEQPDEVDSTGPIALTRMLLGSILELGDPVAGRGLTLLPLFGGLPAPSYETSPDALERGHLRVMELGGGTVSSLLAESEADLPILLIGGEHLEGARQNRMVNASVLLGPLSNSVIPVSCVERGRWVVSGSPTFDLSPYTVSARLRARSHASVAAAIRGGRGRTSNQTEVWDEVARRHAELMLEWSPTDAARDTFAKATDQIDDLTRDIGRPDPEQTGVVACIGGQPVAMDCFDKPETLRGAWDRLLKGYALDAIGADDVPVEPSDAKAFVRAGAEPAVDMTTHAGVGLGTDVVMTAPGLVGDALVWEGGVVHAVLFAVGDPSPAGPLPDRPAFYRRRAGGAA